MSLLAINHRANDMFARWEAILGTSFHADMYKEAEQQTEVVQDENGERVEKKAVTFVGDRLRVPLSMAVRPQFEEFVREMLGNRKDKMNHVPEHAESMFDWSKDDFMAKLGKIRSDFQAKGYHKPESKA